MSDEETVLHVRDAHKRFGDTQALAGVDLQLKRGEWLALLGPNGAGKTTTVKAIAGRVNLDQGEVTLLGSSLAQGTNTNRQKLGVVPQEIALYDTLTARENLHIMGRFHGVVGKQLSEQIDWALDWVSLSDRASQIVKGFSGGMKRRLNIAAAVLHKPEVILLDEPTVGVDPQSRERIWEMLDQLRKDGASLMLTTHQLDEAQQVCDRIVIVDHGKAIANGTLEELVHQTVGRKRTVIAQVGPQGAQGKAEEWKRPMDDVASELPALLAEMQASGHELKDLKIQAPNLQAVFLHLTGRELRE